MATHEDTATGSGEGLRTGTVTAGDLTFTYLEAGEGPLALCLHGFPDTARTWRHMLGDLARGGYRAVAPWMRGYAPTEVPADGAYEGGALGADACALHEALGGDSDAVLIGHDWGALATYSAASWQPARWSRIVTLSVPPPQVLMGGILTPDQLARSWYIWFFQMAGLPEIAVPADDFAFIAKLWEDWSPGYDATEDVAAVRESLTAQPNLEAALGYYRAMLDASRHSEAYAEAQAAAQQPPPQPTLYLHGDNDGCLGVEMVRDTVAAALPAPGSRSEIVSGTGHFLHLEAPERVNALILEHLAS